ncbi:MAG: GNAT family N-acetyltransferase [Phenylobacterium sp.]
MQPADVEILERDTVAAVAPPELLEIGGWLVPLDNGSIGRAKSAVPLRHDLGPEALDEIEAAYHARGLPPRFRIADVASLGAVAADLTRRGYAPHQPTIFKTGSTADMARLSDGPAMLLSEPSEAWAAVFLGDGFDPADGLPRMAALTRSPDAVYGAAGEGTQIQAVGVMSFGARWAGVHGMRTAPAHRGKGLASRVLAALGAAAQARGVAQVFLQVEEANPARRIYRAAGFAPVWRYHYWF